MPPAPVGRIQPQSFGPTDVPPEFDHHRQMFPQRSFGPPPPEFNRVPMGYRPYEEFDRYSGPPPSQRQFGGPPDDYHGRPPPPQRPYGDYPPPPAAHRPLGPRDEYDRYPPQPARDQRRPSDHDIRSYPPPQGYPPDGRGGPPPPDPYSRPPEQYPPPQAGRQPPPSSVTPPPVPDVNAITSLLSFFQQGSQAPPQPVSRANDNNPRPLPPHHSYGPPPQRM
eukprot:TRINITY_DN9093_c0_g2_i1.p1 TRINITY_DN9093_c0_g2~~TRINITY_DN9093_c0_g2_i1.p1  ORF type:complete len:222 (+),score=36.76 TRINITY_DN9093_c0_g2_i1:676-1341(+)